MRSNPDDGQHVRIVNPETGGVVCDDAVIVPRPWYGQDSDVWVLMHHDAFGMYPRTWVVDG